MSCAAWLGWAVSGYLVPTQDLSTAQEYCFRWSSTVYTLLVMRWAFLLCKACERWRTSPLLFPSWELGGWVISLDLHGSMSPRECPWHFALDLVSRLRSATVCLSVGRSLSFDSHQWWVCVCLDHQCGWTQCPQALTLWWSGARERFLSWTRTRTAGRGAARSWVHLCTNSEVKKGPLPSWHACIVVLSFRANSLWVAVRRRRKVPMHERPWNIELG